jgi:hypothetical protein
VAPDKYMNASGADNCVKLGSAREERRVRNGATRQPPYRRAELKAEMATLRARVVASTAGAKGDALTCKRRRATRSMSM